MTDKASILIVDDRPEKVLALEAVLEDLHQEIVRAYSGREALRQVLNREFAVILLDVNMPGMDGFETASLIRQRKSSEHTPIIFITAFGDEMHASRGYSLGAVDYILAPVMPDVLRTKVGVFVDLFRKSQQLRWQAEWLRQRAAQLQKLAAASVAINSAVSVEHILRTITDSARDVIGSHQAITHYAGNQTSGYPASRPVTVSSLSDRYAEWRERPVRLDGMRQTITAQGRTAVRMSDAELRVHPDWSNISGHEIPPVRGGMLAAPLNGHDGTNLGVIYLSDRFDGEFTRDDEAVLVQLAQMGSIAIENSLYHQDRAANQVKDEFLATLSHELRTPLNAMLGWVQLLRMNRQQLPDEVRHGLETIERSARAQARLVEDLLDVSRITSGKFRLNRRSMNLSAVVEAAIEAVRPAAEAKHIILHARLSPVVNMVGDPDRLQQVVWNLLSNAVKFTPVNGRVQITLDSSDDALAQIRVSDNGQGISPQFLPYVFDRFRQADSSSTRMHGGLGIGLTVVRHIIELHGGTVQAHSAGESMGSTFTIHLPLYVADAPSAPAASAEAPAAEGDAEAPTPPAAQPRHSGAAGNSAEPVALANLHVLLIEDDADARELLAKVLRRSEARVTVAADAAGAMEHLLRERPDVIISDIAMPDEDGYSLMRRVRELRPDQGGQTPAVAVTAYAREEDRMAALSAGFQEHICKPVDPAELLAAIGRIAAIPEPARQESAAVAPQLHYGS